MYTTRDIYPVSDFNRKPAEHIKRLQETRRPEVLTVNGKAAVVMMDHETYDKLAHDAALFQRLERIVQASAQHDKGEAMPAKEAFSLLKQRLKEKYPDAKI